MRKRDETLRESILTLARELVDAGGPQAINIREIAARAGIATGTVYNYFDSKEDILLTLTEEYWRTALMQMKEQVTADTFAQQLEQIYGFLSERIRLSGGRLMGSLRDVQTAGRDRMRRMQTTLEEALQERLEQDEQVRGDIWNEEFTKKNYAGFVLRNLVLLLGGEAGDVGFFIEIVRRTLY